MRAQGSLTAESSAAQRALHTLHAQEPKVFRDPFALGLAGPAWRPILTHRASALRFQRCNRWLMPMVAHHLARARYVEERLERLEREGLRQYVLLGAGMNSFVLRRTRLARRLAVLEIDHPATQARKRARLKQLGHTAPATLEYLGVDFEKESLAEGLDRSGFDSDALCLFSWMGVVPYLTKKSFETTLRDITAQSTPGSEVVFDTLDRAVFHEARNNPIVRRMREVTRRCGEPLVSGYDPQDMATLLGRCGLRILEVVTAADFTARWFARRKDGLRPWEHIYVVRAVVT
ncbi:MAG: class I SAM-dependent methyltransferase [Planctomycetales bacterium]|nr:class I SAM-dependent methyltransferase [Planctomycetales bacterium]